MARRRTIATQGEIQFAAGSMEAGVFLLAVDPPPARCGAASNWKALTPEFAEALRLLAGHTGPTYLGFDRHCVHITRRFVEVTNDDEAIRYPVETPLDVDGLLLRPEHAAAVAAIRATEFGESDGWIHFRNETGQVLSCKAEGDEFPDLSPLFEHGLVPPEAVRRGVVGTVELRPTSRDVAHPLRWVLYVYEPPHGAVNAIGK
jgi:hypothetical protein